MPVPPNTVKLNKRKDIEVIKLLEEKNAEITKLKCRNAELIAVAKLALDGTDINTPGFKHYITGVLSGWEKEDGEKI